MTVSAQETHQPPALVDVLMRAKLKLAPRVCFEVQEHRGQVSLIIHEPTQNHYFKASLAIKPLLSRLDGRTQLQTLIEEQPEIASIIRDEQALDVLLQLLDARVLLSDLPLNTAGDIERHHSLRKKARAARWLRPWLLKLPLFNPDRLLQSVDRYCGFLWSRPVFVLWLMWVCTAVTLAHEHWDALKEYWHTRFLDPFNLLLVVLIYPLLKIMHELAHGLTTKKWGGHVYEMGVLFLFFMPVPYVDASASVNFRDKQQRMVVAASGVMVELFFASAALLVWINADHTLVRDIAVNVMLLGAVSTVFFNGNPLLRFDGYYVLSDWLEIPNLSARASAYLVTNIKSCIFGLPVSHSLYRPGEKKWLFFYGILAGVYRVFVTIAITLFIATHYFFIGSMLAILAICGQLLWPAVKGVKSLWGDAQQHRHKLRFGCIIAVLISGAWLFLFEMPIVRTTVASGVLLTPGDSQIKAATSGFLTRVVANDGDQVVAGDALLELQNEPLVGEIRFLRAKIVETQTLLSQFITEDPVQASIYRNELATFEQELADLLQEQQGLRVLSKVDGVLNLPTQQQLLGRFFNKGDLIGSIDSHLPQTAIVVVAESASAAILEHVDAVFVRLQAYPDIAIQGRVVSSVPATTQQLPSRYLGANFGGQIAVNSRDEEGTQALKTVLQYEVEMSVPVSIKLKGARVEAKFVHNEEPLGIRAGLWLRQFILQNLNL